MFQEPLPLFFQDQLPLPAAQEIWRLLICHLYDLQPAIFSQALAVFFYRIPQIRLLDLPQREHCHTHLFTPLLLLYAHMFCIYSSNSSAVMSTFLGFVPSSGPTTFAWDSWSMTRAARLNPILKALWSMPMDALSLSMISFPASTK